MKQNLILFDGQCALCNGSVRWAKTRDLKKKFTFISLYSDEAKNLLKKHHLPEDYLESLVYIKDDQVYLKSTAILEICRTIGGIWKAFSIFLVLPVFIRDWLYSLIAENRHYLTKKGHCFTNLWVKSGFFVILKP